MARQVGQYKLTGTVQGLCFYRMDGEYYVRRTSSLSRKRVLTDNAFALTRVYANLLGQASRLASTFYATLSPEQKKKGLYRQLTGVAMRLLKDGTSADDVSTALQEHVFGKKPTKNKVISLIPTTYSFADALLAKVFAAVATEEPMHHCAPVFDEALKDYGFV